jgi:ketosteroid isomerase-like protein
MFVLSSLAGANMRRFAKKWLGMRAGWMFLALVLAVTPVAAQKKDKNKKTTKANADAEADLRSVMPPLPDTQAVDQAVGEMLGYWQIGDIDSLHKYYADNVVMVSGAFEPPVIGWDNFVRAYQAQRANVTGQRLERSNTYIKVNGDSAWATYQFLYDAIVAEGKVVQFRGHTTLVLNKIAGRWVIVLNHSSIVDSTNPSATAPAGSAPPGGH